MNLDDIHQAISALKDELRAGADLPNSINWVCQEYDVSETLLRHWFAKQEGEAPEEFQSKPRVDVSIDAALDAAASRWLKPFSGPIFLRDGGSAWITHEQTAGLKRSGTDTWALLDIGSRPSKRSHYELSGSMEAKKFGQTYTRR